MAGKIFPPCTNKKPTQVVGWNELLFNSNQILIIIQLNL